MRVLILKEEAVFVAQCLEYDITAQGQTVVEAQDAFVRVFAAQIAVALRHGEEPLAAFERAPDYYWERFNEAQRLADPIRIPDRVEIPPAFMINAMQKTLADSWIAV